MVSSHAQKKLARSLMADFPSMRFNEAMRLAESSGKLFAGPTDVRLIGVDLSKGGASILDRRSEAFMGMATGIEDALTVLRFAVATTMKRYQEMDELGANDFTGVSNHGPALRIVVSDCERAAIEPEKYMELQLLIGQLTRTGRSAGVELAIVARRPDTDQLPGETRANLNCRIIQGNAETPIL